MWVLMNEDCEIMAASERLANLEGEMLSHYAETCDSTVDLCYSNEHYSNKEKTCFGYTCLVDKRFANKGNPLQIFGAGYTIEQVKVI